MEEGLGDIIAEARDDDEIFVYMGGDQEVPLHVRRARIDKSVKIIPTNAFRYRHQLIYVEFHDEIEIIEEWAFINCISLRGSIKLLGVKIIKKSAFYGCVALTDLEFGNVLETIEERAFFGCSLLRKITMPSVRTIETGVFVYCDELSDVVCGEGLETLRHYAFNNCVKLNRIVLPLKDNMIEDYVFRNCPNLVSVDLVGGFNSTIDFFHTESWRNDMMDQINRINRELPNTASWRKTAEIQHWMRTVIRKFEHYKSKHHKILEEATTLLELALWKANLNVKERDGRDTKESHDRDSARFTSGASIVIKNVLPYLQLE